MYLDTTSYTNKDFRTIWPELLELVTDLTDKWDPNNSNEADPGVALLKLKAFIADKLNYNIDKNTLEAFPSSVTQRGNAQKLYDTLGYQLNWYKSAITDVYFKFIDSQDSQDNLASKDKDLFVTFTVPRFAQIKNASGTIVYTVLESISLDNKNVTKTEYPVKAIEGPVESFTINGSDIIQINNLDSNYRLYFTESMVAQNGIFINNVGTSDFWEEAFNLESTQLGKKVFKFGVLPTTNQCYIEFPQDAAELFDQGINIHYVISSGSNGNIKAGELQTFAQEYPDAGKDDSGANYSLNMYVKVNNPAGASNGTDPEDLESAYNNFQKTINTFSTLVTLQDYNNAIYKEGAVSNCVVTDRTNDFNYTYRIKSKTNLGEITVPMISPNMSMNAFNLGLYVLDKVPNVSDLTSYNNTFKTSDESATEAKESIEEYKSVQHDWLDTQSDNLLAYLFKNLMLISGQVLTRTKVSTTEASDILKRIREKLYTTYQSRNLTFGSEISYDDIINTIMSSDERIKTVMLNDIDYATNVLYSDNSSYDILNFSGGNIIGDALNNLQLEIITRSILAGITPLYLFDDTVTYSYTMGPVGSYSKFIEDTTDDTLEPYEFQYDISNENFILNTEPEPNTESQITAAIEDISAITTQVNITPTTDGRKLLNNEQLFIYGPNFISKTTIGTYLYVALYDEYLNNDQVTQEDDRYPKYESDKPEIPAGTVYQLRQGQTLYVCETIVPYIKNTETGVVEKKGVPMLDDNLDGKKLYRYPAGTIIKPSFKLTVANFINDFAQINQLESGKTKFQDVLPNYTNLEANKSIEILDQNSSIINRTEDSNKNIIAKTIKCTWITDDIDNKLFNNIDLLNAKGKSTIEHILQQNELFIYTDATESDLVILQSGTKLSIPYQPAIFEDGSAWKVSKPSASDINKNGVDAKLDWKDIPRSIEFSVEELEIRTLGSGTIVYYEGDEGNSYTFNNNPQELEKASDIYWKVDKDSERIELPIYYLDSEDSSYKWKAFSRLAIFSTPQTVVTLEDNQLVGLFKRADVIDPITGKPTSIYELDTMLGPKQSFATSHVLITPGGIKQLVETTLDDTVEKLNFVVFDYRSILNKEQIEQSLWVINGGDGSKYFTVGCSEPSSAEYIETQIKCKDISTTETLKLSLPLSNIFNSEYFSMIPVIVSAPNKNIKIKFNLESVSGLKFNKEDINWLDYSNKLICLKYPDKTDGLEIEISGFTSEDDIVLIDLYPIKLVKDINRYLTSNYSSNDIDDEKFTDILRHIKTLSRQKSSENSQTEIDIFDYTYQNLDDQILDPLDPISFFNPNHICNNITIPQIDQINLKIARQSLL